MAIKKADKNEESRIVAVIEIVDTYLYDLAEALGLSDGEILTVLSNLITEAAAVIGVPEDELIETTRLMYRLKVADLQEEEPPDLLH